MLAVKEWASGKYESARAERVKLAWLDLSLSEDELDAAVLAAQFGCSVQYVHSLVSGFGLVEARKAKMREEAKAKAERLSLSMQSTVDESVELQAISVRTLKALVKEMDQLTKGGKSISAEDVVKLKNLERAVKIASICSKSAESVQAHAAKLAELRNSATMPTLPAPPEEKQIEAKTGDALLFDEDEY